MNEKILIIEKDLETANYEKDYLEMSGYEVTVTCDGKDGWKKLCQSSYDMLILETDIPEMDGIQICKKLKERVQIPVMFVSDKVDEIDVVRGLAQGADDYMRKPFSPGEMVARVKAHLRCYETLLDITAHKNEIMIFGDLRIDKTDRRVTIKGEERNLTSKEFDLLCFLAEHPNHVYSKEELFRQIWDMDSLGDIATVTVHVKKIREKLEDDANRPLYIETVWGVGYRFHD